MPAPEGAMPFGPLRAIVDPAHTMTQTDLARLFNVTRRTILVWQSKDRVPSLRADLIAVHLLGRHPRDIWGQDYDDWVPGLSDEMVS